MSPPHPGSPGVPRSLYRRGGGDFLKELRPGNLEDCWFVAAVIALARHRPDELRGLVRENGDGSHDVTFPGREVVRGVRVTDAEIARYRRGQDRGDGLLLPVLEKAYGLTLNPRSREPFEEINA